MKKSGILIMLIILAALSPARAQLTVSGEFRPRAEVRGGYGQLRTDTLDPAYLVSQRTRLAFLYQKDWIKAYVSFQDVRLWGGDDIYSSTGMFGYNANVDLNEAWVQLSFLGHSSVKFGRQLFNYDDGRLLSARNWNDRGIFYDALLYQFQQSGWSADLALSYFTDNNDLFDNYYPSGKMRTLNFLRVQKIINPNLTASVIALGSGYTKNNKSETIYMKGSYGTMVQYKDQDFSGWTSFYYQNGKSPDGRTANAWNFNMKADQKVGKFTGGIGLSLISGEKSDTSQDDLFDLLYGVRHLVYGYMDYFNNLPKATQRGGLNDLYLTTKYPVSPKTELLLDYHYFALNQPVDDLDKYLGSEFDLGISITFNPELNIRGGYSVMLPGSSMETIQKIDEGSSAFSSWAYVMLTLKPTIFRQKE